MLRKIEKFYCKYGLTGILRLIFWPVTAIFTMPVQLALTLWNSRVLLRGNWQNYPHFNAFLAITSLFYWTRAQAFVRYDRNGVCPYTGLGNYSLSKYFFYTLPSLYAYWKAGVVTLLVGMFGWLLAHFCWYGSAEPMWLVLVLFLALISSTFYYQTFGSQNYNVLGWMFFPIGVYGLASGNYFVASIGWLLCSWGSFTSVFIAALLSVFYSLYYFIPYPVLAVSPAVLKLLLHFIPVLKSNNSSLIIAGIAKAIGLTGRKVKYKRPDRGIVLTISNFFFLILYVQFALVAWYTIGVPILFLVGILIFLANSTFFRFADIQSIILMQVSLALPYVILNNNIFLLASFWILVSPPPVILSIPGMQTLDRYPVLSPFNVKPFVDYMVEFLKPVRQGQKILMAFDDPQGSYAKVFDGYRVNIELVSYVASLQKIHFMPDWWAVFEVNYEGAPDFWCREPDEVVDKMKEWQADYVIIYQDQHEIEIDPKWIAAGFEVLSEFSWGKFEQELTHGFPKPNWWLLTRRK